MNSSRLLKCLKSKCQPNLAKEPNVRILLNPRLEESRVFIKTILTPRSFPDDQLFSAPRARVEVRRGDEIMMTMTARTAVFAVFLTVTPTIEAFVPQRKSLSFPKSENVASLGVVPDADAVFLETATSLAPSVWASQEAVAEVSSLREFSALWSSCIMLTIVSLLYTWEKSVELVRETVPKVLLPVVESILAEMGGLGFIGLLLEGLAGYKESLGELSMKLFGEEEVLIESFEFLHTVFFQVAIAFFIAGGGLVVSGVIKSTQIGELEKERTDETKISCSMSANELADLLPNDYAEGGPVSNPTFWDDLTMSIEERAAKAILLRRRLMDQYSLPESFRSERYVAASFAEKLLEFVELSPLTWIYLIPALALANSVDLMHDVVNAASPNAGESVGYFFSTPWALIPAILTETLSLWWGVWNGWKITNIKYMLIPQLARNPETKQTEIRQPPIDDETARNSFSSSPSWVRPIESIWGAQARTPYEKLFGAAGASGPELYGNSIKLHVWLCITHVVFFGTQIIPRDIDAWNGLTTAGDPNHLTAELVTYGSFVLLSLAQLIILAPTTFWNYCIVTSLEDEVSEELLEGCRKELQ